MKQMVVNKNTIAWFKIAEYVSRGEKERALGVYRLLSYSFNDNAVARQLEADIYLSFDEYVPAINLYNQAMELYEKSQRFLEAAAVCEHLILLVPTNMALRKDIIRLYKALNDSLKLHKHIRKALDDAHSTHDKQFAEEYLSLLRAQSQELYNYALEYSNNA